MISKILNYQKTDEKIIKIDKEINQSETKQNLNELYKTLKDAQGNLIETDKQARRILEELDKLQAVHKKGMSVVERYTKQNLQELSKPELVELDNKVKKASSDLFEIEKRLSKLVETMNNVLQEYEATRKRGVAIKKKIQEDKIVLDGLVKDKEAQKQEIKKELEKLEKEIDAKVLTKYKTLRQEGIFPVVVALNGSRCSGCRMELPFNELDKLKHNGVLECDSCHRIIYDPKEK